MTNVAPSELLVAGFDQKYTTLIQLQVILEDLILPPPYDLFKQIFLHAVKKHRSWSLNLLKEHLQNPEKFQAYLDVLAATKTNLELVLEKFYFYKVNQITESFLQKWTNHSLWSEETEKLVRDYSSNLTRVLYNKTEITEPISGTELMNYLTPQEKTKAVSLTMGPDLDEAMQGGVHPGEVLIFMAATNSGKTSTLLRQAVAALAQNYRVFYASLEMGLDVIAQRVNSAFQALRVDKKTYLPNLYVKQYPSKRVSMDEIFLDIDMRNVDVVVLDYLDLVKYDRSQANWLDLEDTIAYFRGLLVERNQMGFTASQTNRDGIKDSGKTIIGLDKIANSVGKAFTADYIITINPPAERSDITNFFLAKNRRGAKIQQSCHYNLSTLELEPITIEALSF